MAVYLLLEKTLGPLAPQQREMLESARDDADRLLRILDSLLDLTRLEAGASALERKKVAVGELLHRIADEARAFISAAGQELVVEAEAGLGAWTSTRAGSAMCSSTSSPTPRSIRRRGRDYAQRVYGAPRLRALFREGQGARHPRGGPAAHLRPVSTGCRASQSQAPGSALPSPARLWSRTVEASPARTPREAGRSSTSWCRQHSGSALPPRATPEEIPSPNGVGGRIEPPHALA